MQCFLNNYFFLGLQLRHRAMVALNIKKNKQTLARLCVGYNNEAVRIYGRRGNLTVYVAHRKQTSASFNTIPKDRWAASVQHQGTSSRSQVSASVKGTI